MRLIVNADDLGMSQTVNDEVFDLIARGLVTSASVIANAPMTRQAIERARIHPECAFGIHLNLTQFAPLRACADIQPLLQPSGEFLYGAVGEVQKTRALRRAIYKEWSVQIGHCLALGLKPTHLDSHHHVHLMRGFVPVLKRLQWRFGIKRVRGINLLARSHHQTARTTIRKRLWTAAVELDGTRTTDCVAGLLVFDHALECGALGSWLKRRRNGTVELMVHPGNDFHPDFRTEVEMLRSGWLDRARPLFE